jgi:hypothetical protein
MTRAEREPRATRSTVAVSASDPKRLIVPPGPPPGPVPTQTRLHASHARSSSPRPACLRALRIVDGRGPRTRAAHGPPCCPRPLSGRRYVLVAVPLVFLQCQRKAAQPPPATRDPEAAGGSSASAGAGGASTASPCSPGLACVGYERTTPVWDCSSHSQIPGEGGADGDPQLHACPAETAEWTACRQRLLRPLRAGGRLPM